MISIDTLGSLDIRDSVRGRLATVMAQPRRAALLAYLAIEGHGDFVSRDSLLALLWHDYDESRARAALRQALAFLRRALGEQVLLSRGDDAIAVDAGQLSCDLWDFRAALNERRDDEALALYRGSFLDGLVVGDAPAFDPWVSARRVTLAREAAGAAARRADQLASQGDLTRAIERARDAERIEPLNESHHRRLLTLLDRSGDRSGALFEHDLFTARLLATLDVEPAPETRALVASLRGRTAVRLSTSAASDAPPTAPGAGPTGVRVADAGPTLPPPPPSVRVRIWPVVAVAAAIVSAVVVVVRSRDRAALTPAAASTGLVASRIAVLPLTDPAGDSLRIGVMAADWITEGLSRLDDIEVVPAMALLATEAALATAPSAPASERWQQLASDVGAGTVVRGAVYRDGRTIHLQAQVLETRTGRLLRPVERVSIPDDSVMLGIDRLRTRVVAAIAPLADTVTHLSRAIAPPTYEAYRDYVAGLAAFVRGDPRAALSLFERSASADSAYPMPRIAATIMRLNLDDADGAQRLIATLNDERARLGPLELSTLDMAQGLMTGNLAFAYDAVVRQARIAPGTIGEYMIGELARKMNRPAEAVSVLRALGPDRGELRGWRPYWRELTFALHLLGRHDEELVAARDAMRRYPNDVTSAAYELRALAALGDVRAVVTAQGRLDASVASLAERAALRVTTATEFMAHHPDVGGGVARDVTAWFDSIPSTERDDPAIRRHEARALLLAGRAHDAHRRLQPLTTGTNAPATMSIALMGLAGNIAAADGDSAAARRWMRLLAAREQAMTTAARGLSWGETPYWRATIAARLSDSAAALSLLRDARRQGLGIEPAVHAEPAFASMRRWPPLAVIISP